MKDKERCIDVCNQLLRGELSAVETYEQAIARFKEPEDNAILVGMRNDHRASCALLTEHIISMGATPSEGSGAWGIFAQTAEGAARLLGEVASLRMLEEGEKHGITEYEDALIDPEVMSEIKEVIRERLMPPLHEHITTLRRLRNPVG